MEYFQPILGMAFMIGFCLLVSRNRREALRQWRIVAWGIGLQFVFAWIVLKTPVGEPFFDYVKGAFLALLGFANKGAQFVFGDIANPARQGGTILAFGVLTSIVFFASLMAILYHVGIMQLIVRAVAWVMARTMGTSGSESLTAAANIFVGMTEAPLVVRPFVPTLTGSELMAVMTVGFATIAGGVMAVYIAMLYKQIPDIAGHLMAASVMSAPAGLVFAKLLYPETKESETAGTIRVPMESPYDNVVDAAAGGASEGMKLMINVIAMLIAFVALVHLCNGILGWLSTQVYTALGRLGVETAAAAQPLTIERIFGWLFAPLAWMMGVPLGESVQVGQLMGTKTILNELLAYDELRKVAATLSPRSVVLASYSLCGFANLGSVGITIGGLTILAPERRAELARLGLPAMFAGFFACNMTACIAALLIPSAPILAAAGGP